MRISALVLAAAGAALIAAVPAGACGEKKAMAAESKAHCGPGDGRTSCCLQIEGLKDAASCDAVREALAGIPGVKDVTVDLESGKATVSFADPATKQEALTAAVEKAGFRASVPAMKPAMKAAASRN